MEYAFLKSMGNKTNAISLPSVQSLLIQMSFGTSPLSTGTGFVCQSRKGPVLVTNWHNLSGRNPDTFRPLSPTGGVPDRVQIVHNRSGQLGQWVLREELLYDNERPKWIEHPALGQKADIVALPLSELGDVQLYPYELAGGAPIQIAPADCISVVGFPFGIQASGSCAVWATGFVASEPDLDFRELPIFLVDCRSRPGQSGSAVIARRNGGTVTMEDGSTVISSGPLTRFLGIYSGRINDQSDLGIVWKLSAIAQVVESI